MHNAEIIQIIEYQILIGAYPQLVKQLIKYMKFINYGLIKKTNKGCCPVSICIAQINMNFFLTHSIHSSLVYSN